MNLLITGLFGVKGPIPKIVPLIVSSLRARGCTVTATHWGRHRDNETILEKCIGRFFDLLRIGRILTSQPIDILIIHTTHQNWRAVLRDIPLIIMARYLCPQTILEFHGSRSDLLVGPGHQLLKFVSSWMVRTCDAILLLSFEELSQWTRFTPYGKIFLVGNPYAHIENSITTEQEIFRPPSGAPRILFVGQLVREKGIFDLIQAASILSARSPFHLTIAGDGPEERRLKSEIAALHLSEYVTLTGYITGDALEYAYRHADIFVLPSWTEGFPLVIPEAMDHSLPIVTTPIRGALDHITDGENGSFVSLHDPAALADRLEFLILHPELGRRMGRNNQEKVNAFSPEKVGGEYLSVLQEVFRRRHEAKPNPQTTEEGLRGEL